MGGLYNKAAQFYATQDGLLPPIWCACPAWRVDPGEERPTKTNERARDAERRVDRRGLSFQLRRLVQLNCN